MEPEPKYLMPRVRLSAMIWSMSAGFSRRADVDVARGRLEPVLVEQRAVLLGGQAAERERLDVAVAHLAQAAEHLLGPRDRRRVGAEADVLGERPELDRDLAGRARPCPRSPGPAADAVAAPCAPMHAASAAATMRPRSARPKACFMDPPIPFAGLGRHRRRRARNPSCPTHDGLRPGSTPAYSRGRVTCALPAAKVAKPNSPSALAVMLGTAPAVLQRGRVRPAHGTQRPGPRRQGS